MTPTTDMYVLLRAFVDELARCGMRAACTSPGSRSAPLALTLAHEPRLRCYSHIDERCAGFFALGLAKASALPVAVVCTSGTAAAELLAAAVEAREARVPLLLLTADRPAELRDNGAGQAIDQLKLFGSAAKWFCEVSLHEASADGLAWMRTLACRAYWTALEGRPGAVHLNFPLREPLVSDAPLPADQSARPDDAPYVRRVPMRAQATPASLRKQVTGAIRGVLVAGRHERPDELAQVGPAFAEALGWPLLADPLSGLRRGAGAIAHYDALLRDEGFAGAMRPDVIMRVGDLPVSKPLRTWLAGLGDVPQIALDPEGAWQDPASVLSQSLAIDPASALRALAEDGAGRASTPPWLASWRAGDEPAVAAGERGPARDEPAAGAIERRASAPDWLDRWRAADERAATAIGATLSGALSEPAVARELGTLLPAESTLFVASSMPVRDIETFWPVRADPPRVLCNRGVSGIDGTVSSAFGAAAYGGGPTVLLIGDVALAHDIGGLLAATRLGLALTIVLVDNDGGGIFDFLAVSSNAMARSGEDGEQDAYTRHIATPTGLDFARAADLYGLAYEPVETVAVLREALERALTPDARSTIVHVRSERAANVALHGEVWRAVSAALATPAP
jgi:2-succinyl-5-enolpyruvyl-6-hydroxy-3-cyclohexene-1-carboxylate synthase